MHLIDRHRDNGMPGSEACIVGPVILRLGGLFADQPAPKAALMFGLTCPVFLVGRLVLGIALDVGGRYPGVFEIPNGRLRDGGRVEGGDNHFTHEIPLCSFPAACRKTMNGPEAAKFGLSPHVKCLFPNGAPRA